MKITPIYDRDGNFAYMKLVPENDEEKARIAQSFPASGQEYSISVSSIENESYANGGEVIGVERGPEKIMPLTEARLRGYFEVVPNGDGTYRPRVG